jgi:N-acetyl-anhydromuramyl-L-alanine amidase AmpD
LAAITAFDGTFSLFLPHLPAGVPETLLVLRPGYRPQSQTFVPTAAGVTLGNVTLDPFPDFFTSYFLGKVLAYFGPNLVYLWYRSTRMEKALSIAMITLLIPVALLFAIDWGLKLPWTDADEVVREQLQRLSWFPSRRQPIAFSYVRPTYFAGIRYHIASNEFDVPAGGFTIQKGSEVQISAGSTFRMPEQAGILVLGKLIVHGDGDRLVQFLPKDNQKAWGNIAFLGDGSIGSELRHCVIRGGTGRAVIASADGYFDAGGNGKRVGGGILIFNTQISVYGSKVTGCSAVYGGGIYIRNTQGTLAGSVFERVQFENCTAHGEDISAGGALFVKNSFPEFKTCTFLTNKALGYAACGGAIYIGQDARGRFVDCDFLQNTADAEGGALYAYSARVAADEHLSGIVVQGGKWVENKGRGSGGAISMHNSPAFLVNVTFQNNHVDLYTYRAPSKTGASGGAIYIFYNDKAPQEDVCKLDGCTFESNIASCPPGPIEKYQETAFAGGGLCVHAENRIKMSLVGLHFVGNNACSGQHCALPFPADVDGQVGFEDDLPQNKAHTFAFPPKHSQNYAYWFPRTARPAVDLVIKERLLPSDCFGERPANTKVKAVVIHFISARNTSPKDPYNLENIMKIFLGIAVPNSSKTSAHYLIERDGTIHRLVPEDKRAWHAGASTMPGMGEDQFGEDDVNNFSVGIEMVRKWEDSPTQQQYEKLALLLLEIKRRHPAVSAATIVGHDTIRSLWNIRHPDQKAAPKEDPGPLFVWSRMLVRLSELGFDSVK